MVVFWHLWYLYLCSWVGFHIAFLSGVLGKTRSGNPHQRTDFNLSTCYWNVKYCLHFPSLPVTMDIILNDFELQKKFKIPFQIHLESKPSISKNFQFSNFNQSNSGIKSIIPIQSITVIQKNFQSNLNPILKSSIVKIKFQISNQVQNKTSKSNLASAQLYRWPINQMPYTIEKS